MEHAKHSILTKWKTGLLSDQARYNRLDECGVFGQSRKSRKLKRRAQHLEIFYNFILRRTLKKSEIDLNIIKLNAFTYLIIMRDFQT